MKKINKFCKIRFDFMGDLQRGSALLVAILVMGLLMTLTLGLSSLVLREIRQTSDVVKSGQAYFSAEAGIENALLDLAENLPGYENCVSFPEDGDGYDGILEYFYCIYNKGDKFPYFPDDEPVFLSPDNAVTADFLYDSLPEFTYNVLPLNESVTIPLFTVDYQGNVNDIGDFLVQYYVNFGDTYMRDIKIKTSGITRGLKLDDFDILRWKVFGNPCFNGECDYLTTDAISDFYPSTDNANKNTPVCIGTPSMLTKFNCIAPVLETVVDGDVLDSLQGFNSAGFSYARQCFLTEVSGLTIGNLREGSAIQTRCNIKSFIENHTKNYITLTNMVNPDLIGINPDTTPEKANIYYRIVTGQSDDSFSNNIVREYADIRSDGVFGDIGQSINAKLRLSSFLPVFNFSLYHTDTN